MGDEILLEVRNVSKQFPGVQALDNVTIDIKKGEVHALCGENGAGKSTLMHILSGIYKMDAGKIILSGKETVIENQYKAQQLGISTVYQERSLVNNLSIAENIYAGRQPLGKSGLINWKSLYHQTKKSLDSLGLGTMNPKELVGSLSPAMQQMVEIAKALSINAKILILDEPTATITECETQALFSIIRKLKDTGVSVIYISHRLAEIFEIADRVSVLKDGKFMGTREVKDVVTKDIIKLMVGRDIAEEEYSSAASDEIILELKNFNSKRFKNVGLQLHRGEILSLAGLAGAGRTELARAVIGADPKNSGEVVVEGKTCNISMPLEAISHGIGYMPEDRKEQGLFLEMSVAENIFSAKINFKEKNRMFDRNAIAKIAEEYKQKLRIATPDVFRRVLNLSGGNQQKVVLAKWLLLNPKILIVDEPTRGVDVGAKAEIYKILRDLAKAGTSIIVISSDLPEVITLSDRVYVMWNGSITGELNRKELTEEKIMHYASGLNVQACV